MKKHVISLFILIAYCAFLLKVMVFKIVPNITAGQVMLNFGGTAKGQPNFVPFATILPYLIGANGWIIGGLNLVGNIALLVPIGFLVPLVYRNMTVKKSLALAVAFGLSIEIMQVMLRVGIFDIDDVILNAFGVMIGYWAFTFLAKWARLKEYKKISITAGVVILMAAATLYAVEADLKSQPQVKPGVGANDIQTERLRSKQEGKMPQSGDPCGGTGGIGPIVSVGSSTFTIKRKKNGITQIIKLTNQTTIRNSAGFASESDLKIGERVTLVGGPNPDGSFTAEAVLVCNISGSKTQPDQQSGSQ